MMPNEREGRAGGFGRKGGGKIQYYPIKGEEKRPVSELQK